MKHALFNICKSPLSNVARNCSIVEENKENFIHLFKKRFFSFFSIFFSSLNRSYLLNNNN